MEFKPVADQEMVDGLFVPKRPQPNQVTGQVSMSLALSILQCVLFVANNKNKLIP